MSCKSVNENRVVTIYKRHKPAFKHLVCFFCSIVNQLLVFQICFINILHRVQTFWELFRFVVRFQNLFFLCFAAVFCTICFVVVLQTAVCVFSSVLRNVFFDFTFVFFFFVAGFSEMFSETLDFLFSCCTLCFECRGATVAQGRKPLFGLVIDCNQS